LQITISGEKSDESLTLHLAMFFFQIVGSCSAVFDMLQAVYAKSP